MKEIKLRHLLRSLIMVILLYSCKEYDSMYTDQQEIQTKVFNGTLLDYLEKGDTDLGIKYDSMLVVINGIEGLRDSLSRPNANLTLFAVSDASVSEAFTKLNSFRAAKKKGKAIYLNDLLIEPFVVLEKLPGETPEADSITIEHPYDYRLQLDSMICKYIFNGKLTSDIIGAGVTGLDLEAFKYRYRMNLLSRKSNASGIEQMGRKEMFLSDKNNTQLIVKWDRSSMQQIDIQTNNGVVHVLSSGHEFSFSKMISRFQNYGNEYIYE